MSIKKIRAITKGNTLIEVLIATAVVGVVIAGISGTLSQSFKNSSEAQNRQVATRLAQDGLEMFAQHKATSTWTSFASAPADAAGTSYLCITDSSTVLANATAQSGITACPVNPALVTGVNTTFYRGAQKNTSNSPDKVDATVVVAWYDGTSLRTVVLKQAYFKF